MAEALIEELTLDIQPALDALEPLGAALTQLATDFAASISDALASLSETTAAPVSVDVTADTSGLDSGIADALDAPRPPIDVEGDTSVLTGQIDDATSTVATIPVDADTSEATAAIGALSTDDAVQVPVTADVTAASDAISTLDNQDVEVTVDADTTAAADSIDNLGGSAGGADSSLSALKATATGLGVATGVAAGETGSLTGAIGGLGEGFGAAIAGGAALTAFLGETIHLAADAQAQQARFNSVFGASAEILNNISVGGLNTSLEELSKTTGTTVSDLEASASRIGLLGTTSGATAPQVAGVASQVLALAGTFSVVNPRLGDAATIADTLSRAFITGRTRALVPYGIALTQAQITQEALTETQKASADQLTGYDKLVAGVTLALQAQGNTLGTQFAQGAQNAQVQLRALKVDLEETLIAVGGPLLQPAVQSFQDLLPVAQQVGIVLGNVAQIILPLVADLGPPLKVLADGLGFVADGVSAVGDDIDAVESPLGAATVGIGLLAAAFAAGVTPALAFGAAVDIATGPIGLVAAGLGLLAGEGLFERYSKQAEQATIDTSSLSEAFSATATGGNQFVGTINNVNAALDTFIQKQLTVGKSGQQPIDALNALGVSTSQFESVISGSQDAYDKFVASLLNTAPTTDAEQAQINLSNVLGQTRDSLEAGAAATLKSAVQTGLLTQANTAAHGGLEAINLGIGDQLALLRELQPVLDAAAAKQLALTNATALQKQAFETLSDGIARGTTTAADAATVATQLGISTADATTFINAQAAAVSAAKDATIEATPAAQRLVDQLQTGVITTRQAQAGFADLGISIGGISTFTSAAASAVTSFISSVNGALPSAGDAIDKFGSDVKAAFTKASDDAAKGTGDIKADLKSLADDSDPARFAANLNQQTANILTFTSNLSTLINEGFGPLAASLAAKGPEAAGALASGLASSPAKAKIAAAAEELNQTAINGLDALAKSHFPQLQTAGQNAGTAITQGISQGVDQGTPGIAASVDKASTAASAHFTPNFADPIPTAFKAAATALAADSSVSNAAGQKGLEALAAFENAYGPASNATAAQVALAGAHDAIAADPSLAVAAGQKGKQAADAFKPDIAGAAQTQISKAATLIPSLVNLPNVTGLLGVSAGEAFGQGLANGIGEKDQAIADAATAAALAAEAAANKALGIQSPSTVGITIGQQFVAGVAVGLADTAPAVAASSALSDALVKKLQDELANAGTAATAQQSAQQALTSFISTATGALPTAADSISTFSQNLSSALSAQSSALSAVHKDYATFGQDQTKVTDLQLKAFEAALQLNVAQKAYDDQVKADGSKTTAAQKANLKDLSDALGVAKSAFESYSSAVRSAQSATSSAGQQIATDAKTLSAANKTLTEASSANAFISNLNAQTAAAQRFGSDIAKLVHEGFPELAKELSTEGVNTAGKLAEALASSPAKAKSANAAVLHAEAFSTSFSKELTALFAPGGAAGSVAATAGQQTGQSLTTGLTTALAAGTSNALKTFNAQVAQSAAAIPKIDLTPSKITPLALPKAIPPIIPATPLILTAPVVGGVGTAGSTLELNLSIVLDDGRVVTAKTNVPVPATKGNLTQRVVAEVHAS